MTKASPSNPLSVQVENGHTNGIKRDDSLSTIPYQGQPRTSALPSTDSQASVGGHSSDGEKGVCFEVGSREYIPLHEKINRRINDGTPFFSLEFFPPKTANGVANFFTRLDRFNEGLPLFVDITWHMNSDPANMQKETSSSSIALGIMNYCRVETMLHMTCVQYSKAQTVRHLAQSKKYGLRNILALRGDLPPSETSSEECQYLYRYRALDMIRWIREEFGDYFTIACSGYPLGHPDAPSYRADLMYLKAKVDAGAQFIVTQLFFEAESFEKFVRDCREIGITCPIIPGIMPIMGYESIRRIATLSQLTIPEWILNDLEPIKHDDDAVRKYGTVKAIEMCRRLLSNGSAKCIHLYTMNREGTCREILQELGLWQKKPMRALPWEPHGGNHPIRCKEDVRPIFWSARPKSYIYRTRDWDDFPNGRWGNSSSPAFNDLKDYYLFHLLGTTNKDEQLKKFGYEIADIEDVKKVFLNFLTQEPNENGVVVTSLPWSEQESGVAPETKLIQDQLTWCNENGIFTINSQPSVNGAPSSDPLVGWGKHGGYCYQKAYLECFISEEHSAALQTILEEYAPRINYHIINHNASVDVANTEKTTPIAVTWGVFPGCEIAQPTVVDPISFRVWKDEAYEMWTNQWASLYAKESNSRQVLEHIHDTYHLVNLVDNDFQKPCIIFEILSRMVNLAKEISHQNEQQIWATN
ncbi:unnamed protein product, partial [Mesorhabditis belari]|uniref:methylenetetrahydrofolate reductase (NADPH) n=1 Tax=Mesorhabditis belari TaxID=2138241 RepID=A0AAF3ERJ5_9BILA